MNKAKKFISIALCIVLCIMCIGPIGAEEAVSTYSLTDRDKEMLRNFWNQETATEGVCNGDVIYAEGNAVIDRINAMAGPNVYVGVYTSIPDEYDGNYSTPMVFISYTEGFVSLIFSYNIEYGRTEVLSDGSIISYEGYETITPDLYGSVDMSGTSIMNLRSAQNGQTHISGVNVSDCQRIETAKMNGQPFCTEFSAVNCPMLENVEAMDCNYKHIEVQPKGYEAPVDVVSLGYGSIGLEYDDSRIEGTSKLYAYPTDDSGFIGWFVDGICVSTSNIYFHQGGGKVYACYAGDVNSDGMLSVADATLIARMALNLIASESIGGDINGDGYVNISDATMIARIALNII